MLRSKGVVLKNGIPTIAHEHPVVLQKSPSLTEIPPCVEQLRDVRHHLHEIARVVDSRRSLDGRVLADDSAVRELVHEYGVILRVTANTDDNGSGTSDDV